jgi:hypothetical protein
MKLNSKMVGSVIVLVMFGGVLALSALGWWQTDGPGKGQGQHASGTLHTTTLHGLLNGVGAKGLSITTDEGQRLYVQIGSVRFNQSLGFAPQVGERVTIVGFVSEQGLFRAMTVTSESNGQVYHFRDSAGQPLWTQGEGQGNGNH